MAEPFSFNVLATDGKARRGVIDMPRGEIRTPAFMPVGTGGTVRPWYMDQVRGVGADIILGNTYHLMLRPAPSVWRASAVCMNSLRWPQPILTDSGGFQVDVSVETAQLTEKGVTFRSHIDGAAYEMTPERSIEIQGCSIPTSRCSSTNAPRFGRVEGNRARDGVSLRWASAARQHRRPAGQSNVRHRPGRRQRCAQGALGAALSAMGLKGYAGRRPGCRASRKRDAGDARDHLSANCLTTSRAISWASARRTIS